MKKRVLYFFALVLWLLVACTILSPKIENEMAVQVQILQRRPIHDSNAGTSMTMEPVFYEGGTAVIYEVLEGTGWSEGPRIRVVPEDRWEFEFMAPRPFVQIVGGRIYDFVQHSSRNPRDGDLAQVIEEFETVQDQYLFVFPEGLPEELSLPEHWTVIAQTDTVLLADVPDGLSPFFPHQVKYQTGIAKVESCRIFSLKEAQVFWEQIPGTAMTGAVLLIPMLLWLFSGLMLDQSGRYRGALILNAAVSIAALAGLPIILNTIDFPASLLPSAGILDFSYYSQEFQLLFDGLSSVGLCEPQNLAQQAGAQALLMLLMGAFAAMGMPAAEFLTGFCVRKIKAWKAKCYRGKYLRTSGKK